MSFPKLYKNMGKRAAPFNPDRNYLKKALDEYLAKGGEISQVDLGDGSYDTFLKFKSNPSEVDDFLLTSERPKKNLEDMK